MENEKQITILLECIRTLGHLHTKMDGDADLKKEKLIAKIIKLLDKELKCS